MPVINYDKAVISARKHILENEEISQKNRDDIKRFLDAYEVKPSRESLFLRHLERLLKRTDDFERDSKKPEVINKLFKDLKEEVALTRKREPTDRKIGASTIETVKACSLVFARWLNKGEKPAGYKDIKLNKKIQKRNLEPGDMITWENGLEIAKHTNTLQLKAALLTQLDCGFRPSEFIDLNYGDVKLEGEVVVFNVRGGKTGARQVWMTRAVPYFLQWFDNHPSKRKDDPLWITENIYKSHSPKPNNSTVRRIGYRNLQYRIDLMRDKSGIDKPIDFYNLRHSSCYLDKLDNVPTDLAAERHGHSVEFYVGTYGRLSIADKLARVRNHYGKPEEKRTLLRNNECPRCHGVNAPEAEFCRVCTAPLSVEKAAQVYQENRSMQSQIDQMKADLLVLVQNSAKAQEASARIDKLERAVK